MSAFCARRLHCEARVNLEITHFHTKKFRAAHRPRSALQTFFAVSVVVVVAVVVGMAGASTVAAFEMSFIASA